QAGNRKILAYLRQWRDTTILCVANLSNAAQPVELPLQAFNGRVPVEMLGGTPFPAIGELPYLLTLPPYGFYWMDLSAEAAPPGWHASLPERMPELVTLVLRGHANAVLTDASRVALETEVLPEYLARQRWFPGATPPARARLAYATPFGADGAEYYWAEAEPADAGAGQRVQVPFALVWDETAQVQYPIARVRRGPEVGILADAFLQPGFVLGVVQALRAGREWDGRQGGKPGERPGVIRCQAEPGLAALDLGAEPALQWISGEQSNSSVVIGGQAILKLLRNAEPGLSAEVEMSRHLTRAGYANIPTLLGEVRRIDADDTPCTLAVLYAYIANEGDAWGWTLDFLKRALATALLGGDSPEEFEASLEGYATFAATIGRRVAQLHQVLSRPSDDPAFAPARASREDADALAASVTAQLDRAAKALRHRLDTLEDPSRACAQWLFEHHDRLTARIERMAQSLAGSPLIRVHGDLHLGQVLVAQTDAYLIDFEGEPDHPLAQRRQLASPAKDVAGMLRSFDYAAAAVARQDPLGGAPADANAAPVENAATANSPAQLRDALLARFRARASEAFLQGYEETAAQASPAWRTLLQLAQLEKAAYEIGYEAGHRPDWISIPLCALAGLAHEWLRNAAIDAEDSTS
ncbi:putative maltokinase, partial [Achromobacter ruhlandii]